MEVEDGIVAGLLETQCSSSMYYYSNFLPAELERLLDLLRDKLGSEIWIMCSISCSVKKSWKTLRKGDTDEISNLKGPNFK